MSGKAAQSTTSKPKETSPPTPQPKAKPGELDLAVSALIGFVGVEAELGDVLQTQEGEHEVDFVIRVLGPIGKAAEAQLATITAERDELKRSLRSQKGSATKARNKIEEMKEAARPRKLVPCDLPEDPDGQRPVEFLLGLIGIADEIVLAFSNGKAELRGIAPRKVSVDDFKLKSGRLLFDRKDLVVTGPGGDVATPQLHGVALLLDGEQVAWSQLAQPIDLGPGQSFNLTGNVIFG